MRILRRCPTRTAAAYKEAVHNPDLITFLVHRGGVWDEGLGVFRRHEELPRYDEVRRPPEHTVEERVAVLKEESDRFAV